MRNVSLTSGTSRKVIMLENEGCDITLQMIYHEWLSKDNEVEYFRPRTDINLYISNDTFEEVARMKVEDRLPTQDEINEFCEENIKEWYSEYFSKYDEVKEYSRPDYDISESEYH